MPKDSRLKELLARFNRCKLEVSDSPVQWPTDYIVVASTDGVRLSLRHDELVYSWFFDVDDIVYNKDGSITAEDMERTTRDLVTVKFYELSLLTSWDKIVKNTR